MGGRFVVVIAIFVLVNADGLFDKKELTEDDLKYYYILVNGESVMYNFVDRVINLYKALTIDHNLYLSRFKAVTFDTLLEVPIDKTHEEPFRKLFEDNGALMNRSIIPQDLYVYHEPDLEDTRKPTTTTESAALNEVDFSLQPTTAFPASRKHGCLIQELLEQQIREYVEKVRKTAPCCT